MGGFRRAGLLAAVHAGPATLAGAMKLITSVDEANVVPNARTYELSGRVRNLLADIDLKAGLTASIYDPAVDDERAREIAEQLHVLKTRDEERLAQAQARADADAAAAAAVTQLRGDDSNEPVVEQSKTEQRRLQRNARARELRRQRRAARPGAQPAGSASRRRVLALPDESDDEPVTAASPRYIESDEDNCGAPASFVGDVDCASSASDDSDEYDDDSDSGPAAAAARYFVVDSEAADDDHVFALHQAAILPQDDDDDVSLDAHHWAPGDQAPDVARLTKDGYFD